MACIGACQQDQRAIWIKSGHMSLIGHSCLGIHTALFTLELSVTIDFILSMAIFNRSQGLETSVFNTKWHFMLCYTGLPTLFPYIAWT